MIENDKIIDNCRYLEYFCCLQIFYTVILTHLFRFFCFNNLLIFHNFFFYRKQGVKGVLDISNDNQSDTSNKKQYRKLCSYILQDDNLFPWFSVHETMTIAANLKISKDCMNMEEKQILVSIFFKLPLSLEKTEFTN